VGRVEKLLVTLEC